MNGRARFPKACFQSYGIIPDNEATLLYLQRRQKSGLINKGTPRLVAFASEVVFGTAPMLTTYAE